MTGTHEDHRYVEQLVTDYCGERVAAFTPERRSAVETMFGDVLWQEGIEALTASRVDAILEHTAHHPPLAA